MDRTAFLKHFEVLADTPNAVAKVRKLVLQLAVQGHLVPQDHRNEPAERLVELALRAQKGRSRERKKPRAYNETLYPLPTGWVWTSLDELGDTSPRNEVTYSLEASFSPVSFIPSKYRGNATFETKSWDEVKRGFTHFANEDVVLAKITPCFENGKSAVMRGLKNGIGAGTTELHVFRRHEGCVLPDYVLIFFKSPQFIANGIPRMTGSAGQKRVPWDYFANTPFPLPPLTEQWRIVVKVDELMVLCNELEAHQQARNNARIRLQQSALQHLVAASEAKTRAAHWHRVSDHFHLLHDAPESIPHLRQAILQLAVQGRLVPQERQEKHAGTLLNRIHAERELLLNGRRVKKTGDIPPIETGEADYELPRGWTWARMAHICELITDGTHQTPKYTQTGRVFLSAQNVKPFRFMPENHRFISEDDYLSYVRNRKPEFEDVLLTRVGAGIGEAAVIDQRIDFAFYVSLGLIRPIKGLVDPYYLTLWLNSPYGNLNSHRFTYGKGVSQGNLNLNLIQKFIVPVPPLARFSLRDVAAVRRTFLQASNECRAR